VLTCGPSLGEVDVDRLRRGLDGVLTIAVKQAIDTAGVHGDILCFNSFNVKRFVTPSRDTLRCLVREPSGLIPQLNRADLQVPQSADAGDLARSLAATRDFGKHALAGGEPRPWGPGIMYEIVLHLAVHLGVAEIITVGWDIANTTGRNTHFYDGDDTFFDRERSSAFTAAKARGHLPGPVKRYARLARASVAHARGQIYNRALPVDGETELVGASTAAASAWLKSIGVDLRVVTPSPYVSTEIDRWTLERFYDELGD
jgi:hypothetical protein